MTESLLRPLQGRAARRPRGGAPWAPRRCPRRVRGGGPDRARPLAAARRASAASCLDLGRLDDALDEFDAALGLSPGDEAALLGRAEALIRTGRPAIAAETLDVLAGLPARHRRASPTPSTHSSAPWGSRSAVADAAGTSTRSRSLRIGPAIGHPTTAPGSSSPSLERLPAGPTAPRAPSVAIQGLEDAASTRPADRSPSPGRRSGGGHPRVRRGPVEEPESGDTGRRRSNPGSEPSGPPEPARGAETPRRRRGRGARRGATTSPRAPRSSTPRRSSPTAASRCAALDSCREALSVDAGRHRPAAALRVALPDPRLARSRHGQLGHRPAARGPR